MVHSIRVELAHTSEDNSVPTPQMKRRGRFGSYGDTMVRATLSVFLDGELVACWKSLGEPADGSLRLWIRATADPRLYMPGPRVPMESPDTGYYLLTAAGVAPLEAVLLGQELSFKFSETLALLAGPCGDLPLGQHRLHEI